MAATGKPRLKVKRIVAELEAELEKRTAERDEALARETATAEVLQVINASPGDLAPVFDAMLEKAIRLCGATYGHFRTYDGERFPLAAVRGEPSLVAIHRHHSMLQLGPNHPIGRFLQGEDVIHITDAAATPAYRSDPAWRDLVDTGACRSVLAVALRRDRTLLGYLNVYRSEVRPFSDKEIALLQNFAAQAVIAMENARLITETREALEQQTATAEVLGVINSSPGDLTPVFDAILEKAHSLCGAAKGSLIIYDGQTFRGGATRGVSEAFTKFALAPQDRPASSPPGRLLAGERLVHIPDVRDLDAPVPRAAAEMEGARTVLYIPLRKDDALLGYITAIRQEVRPFSDKQIALLENFAAQAVIAMENARLITETREALEQQTATAEVLGVINASPGDLAPVFDAILEKANYLCETVFGVLWTFDGTHFFPGAIHGPQAFVDAIKDKPRAPTGRGTLHRHAAGEQLVHIEDMAAETGVYEVNSTRRVFVDLGGGRSALSVALSKDDRLLGAIQVYRQEVRPFTDKQVVLLQNFAAQAVIAMENARLLGELRERTGDLQESLEYQTATSDVLKVISRSAFDLQPVLDTLVATATRLCDAEVGHLAVRQGDAYRYVATLATDPAWDAAVRARAFMAGRGTMAGRTVLERQVVHVVDVATDPEYDMPEAVTLGKLRTLLGVPMLRGGEPIGVITLGRQRVKPFTERQIDLVRTFADQAVIAIENARLITETREARDGAENALRDLKSAQANLIQAEKMASLGQLTAGIAHEIKNPLNFVNNFAGLSVELLDELKETAGPALATLDEDRRAEIDETMEMLSGNLQKIGEHGRRADNIVKSMLEHSRGVSGERREVDVNGLIDEALNLAYHGARAQDQGFNITLERAYAATFPQIELAPQEMTRVFLNLFGNGFYAANKRARDNGGGSFRPVLSVATRDLGEAVEVKVRDNGTGIPPEIRDKLFQPFFTTKPTGEGTGLGLSISYDIVTQQHGGSIEVESRVGEFTEFTVRLPRHP